MYVQFMSCVYGSSLQKLRNIIPQKNLLNFFNFQELQTNPQPRKKIKISANVIESNLTDLINLTVDLFQIIQNQCQFDQFTKKNEEITKKLQANKSLEYTSKIY